MTNRTAKKWTDADRELLRMLFPTTPIDEIAVRLGRSSGSIWGMASIMKLSRDVQPSQYLGDYLIRHPEFMKKISEI